MVAFLTARGIARHIGANSTRWNSQRRRMSHLRILGRVRLELSSVTCCPRHPSRLRRAWLHQVGS